MAVVRFQPALPARGATSGPVTLSVASDFNPRSPRGERLASASMTSQLSHFNPRSPRGERPCASSRPASARPFQPTLPARGATFPQASFDDSFHISTHAPREGSDGEYQPTICPAWNFNPRSPRGERPPAVPPRWSAATISTHAPREGSDRPSVCGCCASRAFQPTLPARGATQGVRPAQRE